MAGKIIKWILIGSLLVVGAYFCWFIYEIMTWGVPYSSKKELIANYREKHSEIATLKRYFNSIVPDSVNVYIEFNEDNSIDLKVYKKRTDSTNHYPSMAYFQEWNIDPYNHRPDTSSLGPDYLYTFQQTLQLLGWNDDTFRLIKQLLDKANCISVTNGDPAQIGFRRSGLGMYFYNLFDEPIGDSLKQTYNDSCIYILFNDKVSLEYGGGAIGPQCFPDAKD